MKRVVLQCLQMWRLMCQVCWVLGAHPDKTLAITTAHEDNVIAIPPPKNIRVCVCYNFVLHQFYLSPQEYTQLSKTSIFYALIFKLLFFSFSFLLRRYPNIKTDNVSLKQRYKPLISFQNIYNVIFCLFEDFYLQICFPLWVWMN